MALGLEVGQHVLWLVQRMGILTELKRRLESLNSRNLFLLPLGGLPEAGKGLSMKGYVVSAWYISQNKNSDSTSRAICQVARSSTRPQTIT
jgi:hypothetical protein